MDSNWASENLQVIRTLMERAAIYRRALAPTSLVTGTIGTLAAIAGWALNIDSPAGFYAYWLGVSLATISTALVIVRKQSLRAVEPFWSPPARRVVQAMFPPLTAGLALTLAFARQWGGQKIAVWWLIAIWLLLYGCALNAAGFFMPRGIKLFGLVFMLAGGVLLVTLLGQEPNFMFTHVVMGATFGGLHLAYGAYLHCTEKVMNAA